MSFQWKLIAGYLYFEIVIVIILILPIFSPRRWNHFFKSRIFSIFRERTSLYTCAFLIVLTMFFYDAVREVKKYSNETGHTHLAGDMKTSVKLFRAQRNAYITSFAIFLTFLIKRLVTMILIQHELEVKAQEIFKKAVETVNQVKTTVLNHNLQNKDQIGNAEIKAKLDSTEKSLQEEKNRVRELEEEATKWRLKYEEIVGAVGDD